MQIKHTLKRTQKALKKHSKSNQKSMASMGFSSTTVASLMSLVDEHKEEVTEASYIEMCNALKHLHNRCTQPYTPPPYRPMNYTPPPYRPMNYTPPPYRPFNNTPPPAPHIRPQLSPTQLRIQQLEASIYRHDLDWNTINRLTNLDKIHVLESILRSHSIDFRPSMVTTCVRVDELKFLLSSRGEAFQGVISQLPRMYRERRDARREETRLRVVERTQGLRTELAELRATL